MTTSTRRKTNAPQNDYTINVYEAAARAGYNPNHLRDRLITSPPWFKVRGAWRVWASDFDQWLADRRDGVA